MTSQPTAAQLLQEARAAIADRDHWTVQHMARAFDDAPVDVYDHRACKFCVHGALMRVRKVHGLHKDYAAPAVKRAYNMLRTAAIELHGHAATSRINDFKGHAAILAVLDLAINYGRAPYEVLPSRGVVVNSNWVAVVELPGTELAQPRE